MSALKGFSGKTFYAAAQPALDNTGNRNVMTCLVVLMMICGVVVVIVLFLRPSTYQTAQNVPQAAIVPNVADVPIAPATDQTDVHGNAVRNPYRASPGVTPCTQVSAECGSIATPVDRHTITSRERAALAVVYPTSAPIPAGVDSACFYAEKFNVSCDDVKSATTQMLQWQAEDGR